MDQVGSRELEAVDTTLGGDHPLNEFNESTQQANRRPAATI